MWEWPCITRVHVAKPYFFGVCRDKLRRVQGKHIVFQFSVITSSKQSMQPFFFSPEKNFAVDQFIPLSWRHSMLESSQQPVFGHGLLVTKYYVGGVPFADTHFLPTVCTFKSDSFTISEFKVVQDSSCAHQAMLSNTIPSTTLRHMVDLGV